MKKIVLITFSIIYFATSAHSSTVKINSIFSDKNASIVFQSEMHNFMIKQVDFSSKTEVLVNNLNLFREKGIFSFPLFFLCAQRSTVSNDEGTVYWDKIYFYNCDTGERLFYWDLLTNQKEFFMNE